MVPPALGGPLLVGAATDNASCATVAAAKQVLPAAPRSCRGSSDIRSGELC